MLREVSPQACAKAVLKVIAGSSQELVSSGPIRPLLALAALAPGLNKPILKRLGVLKAFRDRVVKPHHKPIDRKALNKGRKGSLAGYMGALRAGVRLAPDRYVQPEPFRDSSVIPLVKIRRRYSCEHMHSL
jgi:hypothetical protein